jgi:hypothetical protein
LHVGSYSEGDVRKLQSRPDATKVWYIDITDVMDGETPKPPQSKQDVFQTWAITAATLYPFKINVTTDADVYEKAGVENSGCSEVVYEGIGDGSYCGLNIFGTRSCCVNHIYNDGYATGRIVNHEAGHGWGLAHDGGDDGGEYFNGLREFQWTPLMGNVWPGDRWEQALFHYSKGEYDTATNHQDDFEIINETLDYVDDDIPDTTAITLNGTAVERAANWGQIHRNTDTDTWTFKVANSGHAKLKVDVGRGCRHRRFDRQGAGARQSQGHALCQLGRGPTAGRLQARDQGRCRRNTAGRLQQLFLNRALRDRRSYRGCELGRGWWHGRRCRLDRDGQRRLRR